MLRRARPLLGTLVEIGVEGEDLGAIEAGFSAITAVQAQLSRFDPGSDIARFAALPVGATMALGADTTTVLQLAQTLHQSSAGLFDISLGSGAQAWHCEGHTLHKHQAGVQLDLGGIGKGHAVDRAVATLQAAGVAAGWVNAGGDLRVFGAVDLPVYLREETQGGVLCFAFISDGAFATSHYSPHSRCQLIGPGGPQLTPGGLLATAHTSVAAPSCLWADALTKVAALAGPACQALLDDAGATAWWH